MNRNFGIGILVFCFSLSSVNGSLAAQAVAISPMVVQPYDMQELNQQMLDRDRQNRDEEIEIQRLIEENNKLIQDTLARQQDEGLAKIDQTMLNYRNALFSRDQARIMANSERWPSRYGDLIALTEDADAMTENRRNLENKNGLLVQKYQMLTEFRDEMVTLNERLKVRAVYALDQKDKIIAGYKEIARQQQDKIKMLVDRLDEMDKKISHFDEMMAQKDRQIEQLKDKTHQQGLDLQARDESIRWLNRVLAAAENKAEYYRLTSQRDQMTGRQVQEQVDLLKSELENKIVQEKKQGVFKYMIQDLKIQLQGQEDQIAALKAKIQSGQETQAQADTLKNELDQKEHEVELLNKELKDKIAQEKNQSVLEYQIHGLKVQLQGQEDRIDALRARVRSGQETQAQADTLRQQAADQQNKVDSLKQELDNKITQYNQMTLIVSDYQKKLESRDNAYNQQLRQVLLSKNGQAQMEGQIADLSARLQEKEAEVIKIKKDMYDLQELTAAKDRQAQAKDLSLSMIQQKMMGEKINEYQEKINGLQATNGKQAQEGTNLRTELALAREQLGGMPSRDEIDYLKTGLKKATERLKQKDEMLLQTKANADEYSKEFKEQSKEFQSLKAQLQDAYAEIKRKNEDLKFKDLALARLKYLIKNANSRIKDLRAKLNQAASKRNSSPSAEQVIGQIGPQERLKQALDKIDEQDRVINALTQKLRSKTNGNNVQALQTELNIANSRIKNLETHLKELKELSKGDRLREKLKQALDEIDEQGWVVNLLVKKLHEAGQSVDLSREFAKP